MNIKILFIYLVGCDEKQFIRGKDTWKGMGVSYDQGTIFTPRN